MLLLSRRVEWCIIWPWKVMLKIWPQVKVMTWSEKVMLHINQFVSSAWTHLLCFHRSSWSLSKVIPEKLLWSSMTWNDLGDMVQGAFGHNIPTQGVNSTCNLMFESFWMVFVQKRRLSFFSRWLIMERSQNWPDLRSPISKFRDIYIS